MDKLTGGTLTPAYGRDYTKREQAEKDFRDNKDFVYHGHLGSGYCSIRDFAPGSMVKIRYNGGRYATVVKV